MKLRDGAESLQRDRSEPTSLPSPLLCPSLAAIRETYELIGRGVVSGDDVSRLLRRLSELFHSEVTVERGSIPDDPESLVAGSRVLGKELYVRLGSQWLLRVRCCEAIFTPAVIDTINLLALPLATCLRDPIAERALHAPSNEGADEALKRLGSTVRLDRQGTVLEWSDDARMSLRHLGKDCDSEQLRSVVLAAAQSFLRGEKNLQRLVPTLFISFAFLRDSDTDVVLGMLHSADAILNRDPESPIVPLLSQAEMTVAMSLSCGEQEAAIGRSLGISIETVKTHRKHVYEKLGIASRLELLPFFQRSS